MENSENKTVKKAAPKAAPQEKTVRILYVDSVLPNNQIRIGRGCTLTGSGRVFTRTLAEFEGEFMTRLVRRLIDDRRFIILSGLTPEQRRLYNCDYKEGEVIRSEGTFDFLLRCPQEQAVEIFSALCPEHRALVCARIRSLKEAGDARLTPNRIQAFDEIAAADYPDGKSPLCGL